jgi:hypothetical protein
VDRAAGTALLYINGAMVAIDTSIAANFQTSSDFEIGRMEDAIVHFPGKLDEIQVSTTRRPVEWLRTSYNNQSQPGMFHTFGTEQPRP